eukprot:tig00020710_g13269.t1
MSSKRASGSKDAPAGRSAELHDPVLDPQRENGLLAALSDSRKLADTPFAFVWGSLEALFAVAVSILLHRFVIAVFDAPVYHHMKATTAPNKCPPSLQGADLASWLACHAAADLRYFAIDVPRIWASTALLIGALLLIFGPFFHLSPLALLRRMGLGLRRPSGTFWAVALMLALELGLQYGYQIVTGDYVLTLENLTARDDGHLMYGRVLDMLLVTPVREEIVYRGIVFHLAFNRCRARGPAVALAAGLFGAVHLMNLVSGHLSPAYITMQVLLGTLIGAYYCTRLLLTGSLVETILLHAANNACSVFIPFRFGLESPFLRASLAVTFLFYSAALAVDVARLAAPAPAPAPAPAKKSS